MEEFLVFLKAFALIFGGLCLAVALSFRYEILCWLGLRAWKAVSEKVEAGILKNESENAMKADPKQSLLRPANSASNNLLRPSKLAIDVRKEELLRSASNLETEKEKTPLGVERE